MFLKSFVLQETQSSYVFDNIDNMRRKALEILFHDGAGFSPLVTCPGWQVAQLNDRPDLHADTIRQVERHDATDEVFILVKGDAALVIGAEGAGAMTWETVRMKLGLTYNIPRGVWHTIMTSPGMQVMIFEKDNTHLDDVVHRTLTGGEQAALRAKLARER